MAGTRSPGLDRHVHTSPESPAFQVPVVEDHVLLRAVAVEYLEEYGYSVLEAETADEACLMLRANGRIGVVFTDIELPGRMTGFDLARWIGREHTDVRALLTSGHVAPAQLQGRQLVTKPYALDEVERQPRGLVHCS